MSKKVERMRRALMRSNTRLLLSAVAIFQALALALEDFRRRQTETVLMTELQ